MVSWPRRSRKIPSSNTIESVSQRATSKLRRHTDPTQVLDIGLRPGTEGPFESHGVEILLPRHGVNNEIWLVEEVEIAELESQLLQWRITLLQRDHESRCTRRRSSRAGFSRPSPRTSAALVL